MLFWNFVFVIILINFYPINAFLPSTESNTLNICYDPEDQCSFYFHENFPEMSVSTYLGDRMKNIQKVMDCAATIWQASTTVTRLSLMKVYRRHGINKLAYIYTITRFYHAHRFFEKIGYEWREITDTFFEYKMEKLKRERILDLKGRIHPRIYFQEEQHLYGLPSYIIIPYENFEVISVLYDFEILWERQYGRGRCTCVIIHGTINEPRLVHMHIKHIECHEEIYLIYNENKFKTVTKYYFYHVLNHLDRLIQEQEQDQDQASEEAS